MKAHERPGFIPPYQDSATLCAHLCISDGTLDAWVRQGLLPPPRRIGGKRLWKWSEVVRQLDGDGTGTESPQAMSAQPAVPDETASIGRLWPGRIGSM
jgi:hypothetical protein